jgi:hypothetical protein
MTGGGVVDSAGEELEVRGNTDRWGRPGSEWETEEGELGRAANGPENEASPHQR